MVTIRSRFAPSPTGFLHLGHAYSAVVSWNIARKAGGQFLVRIEDIDFTRCREHFCDQIFEDLSWLGLEWPTPVLYQSRRARAYESALQQLSDLGLCFPCCCTRKDIASALSALHGPANEPGGLQRHPRYPGTCNHRLMANRRSGDAIRIDMRKAIECLGGPDAVSVLFFRDVGPLRSGCHHLDPDHLVDHYGDFVVARGDIATSYNLAVVIDDAAQDISHVVRGEDLFAETALHRLLQALLDLPIPVWLHHKLVTDASGKRLAKRHDAMAISRYRDMGWDADALLSSLDLRKCP